MINVEEELYKKKDELEMLEIPENMEQKLREALSKKRRKLPTTRIAALLIISLVFTYSFDALAYYGKNIIGYDEVMSDSLKNLNEEGLGQQINKSCVFSNDVEVSLEGVMFDNKELVAFIKVHSKNEKLADRLPLYDLNGLKPSGYHMKSGRGKYIDEYTAVFTQSFEAPQFYEKWMKLDIKLFIEGKIETQTISFTLNRNKAFKQEITKKIDKQVQIGDYNIKFESISASRMSTNIYGKIIPLNESASKVFSENDYLKEFVAPNLMFDIVANEQKVIQSGGGRSSSGGEISFHNESEALPKDLKALTLRNIRLEYNKIINKEAYISSNTENEIICDDLIIRKVEAEGSNLSITISSKGIPVVGLFDGESQLEQINIDDFKYEGRRDILVDRVYKFTGVGDNLKLEVKVIRYADITDKSIEIPID